MGNEQPLDPQWTVDLPTAPDPSTLAHGADHIAGETFSPEASAKRPTANWPAIPGYEIVKELGRGGMGVVFLARQSNLKRMVALKMIRAGAGASPEELERFRVEGEAVARLQHPNIVQIFEVGEYAGNPFFALEFAPGGSMAAALAVTMWTQAGAVEIVESLARAVHHAHQKNVVHRDLKPANVLLTIDGVPKITDFGLAKRLEEGDSGHTRTGAVMGTPSYMAPEQAAGRVHQIGPATDVYALGAILYECITGRVPFKGESVLDTLDMVRSAEPAPPSKVRPGVPKDLETICLKAMAKEPSARYSSALAMAQDLERYRSGEPILGRRAGIVQKVVRKIRRNKAVALAVFALLVAAGTVSAALLSNRSSSELRAIDERVAQGLERSHWDADAADGVERDIAKLTALDAARGKAAQQKLLERFAEAVRADLKKPRVLEADVPGLEAQLAWLAARDADLARALGADLRARLRAWQPIAEAVAPFANSDEIFSPGSLRERSGQTFSAKPILSTRISALGTIRVTADFDGDWQRSHQVGVVIGYRANSPANLPAGYSFVLRANWPKGDVEGGSPPPFPATFDNGGDATLEILRDGARLGVLPVNVRPGPIRITGERRGERLSIQLNGAAALPFHDPVPLPFVAGSSVALHCPSGTSLQRLLVEGQALSPTSSALERADDLYSRGQTADALALYEAFAVASAGAEVKSEAEYKAGMCLTQLERGNEAMAHFEAVATGRGARWGVVAAFQLWLIHLKAKRFEDADHVLSLIKGNYPKETIASYVPVSIRAEIGAQFYIPVMNKLVFDPKLIPQYESAVRLAEILQLKSEAIDQQNIPLLMAYALSGNYRKARSIGEAHINAAFDQDWRGDRPVFVRYEMTRWHAWMSRLAGEPNTFIDRAEKHYARPLREGENAEDRKRGYLPFKLEHARNLAIQGKWDSAEKHLDEYFAEFALPRWDYFLYSQSYFMKGFVRLQAGDEAGAAAAWKEGAFSNYKSKFPKPPTQSRVPQNRISIAETWAMQAMTGTLTDEDANEFYNVLFASFAGDELMAQLGAIANVTPALMRAVWNSPRGKECARRMAFFDMTPNEYYWTVPRLMMYEKFRQDLAGVALTAEQDDAVWNVTVKTCEAFRTGDFTKPQAVQFALAYKGVTNLLGWGGLAPQLKPELRGPMAYALGLRYRRKLNKPAEAAAMFKTAAADAPADSPLKKLAEAELAAKK